MKRLSELSVIHIFVILGTNMFREGEGVSERYSMELLKKNVLKIIDLQHDNIIKM